MTQYVITAPDGRKFRITAPEGTSEAEIQDFIREQSPIWTKKGSTALDRAMATKEANAAAGRGSVPTVPMTATAGMSSVDKFRAGAGKGLYDIARGAGQITGIQSQGEIDESAKLDRDLTGTNAGMAGHMLGQTAPFLPLAAVPLSNTLLGGALVGGASGALLPTETGESRTKNVITGAALGGGTAAATRSAGVAKSLIDPFTASGRAKIVADTLARFRSGGTMSTPKTPGWKATVAEASGDPGLSVLQRGAASKNPQLAAALADRRLEQNAAAAGAIERIAGTEADMNMAKALRSYMTEGFYDQAQKQGVDQGMTQALAPQIENLMARPSIKAAIRQAEGLFDEQSIALAKSGDVRGLQLIKQALDDMIEKAPTNSAIGRNQLKALKDTRTDLINVLGDIAPMQRVADRNYATFSRPINEMEVGRALREKLVPALMEGQAVTPKITAENYARALRGLDEQIPRITGYPGSTVENTLTGPNLRALEGVRDDLAARAAADVAGAGPNSHTAQNLASQNIIANIAGPFGMPDSVAQQVAASVLGRTAGHVPGVIYNRAAEPAVEQELARALMDPWYAQKVMRDASRPPLYPMLNKAGDITLRAAVPAVPSIVGAANSK